MGGRRGGGSLHCRCLCWARSFLNESRLNISGRERTLHPYKSNENLSFCGRVNWSWILSLLFLITRLGLLLLLQM